MRTFALAALALSSCFLPSSTERENLQDEVRSWHEDLRWQRYAAVAQRLAPEERQRFAARVQGLKDDFEVSDYEILAVQPAGEGAVEVRVAFEWQSKRTGLLRRGELSELWRRTGSNWLLAATRHAAGEQLPFVEGENPEK
jgi:hypothetical protein